MDKPPPGPERIVDALRASHLKEVLHQYGEALRARRKRIDRLNVYPVPDGDTGTNMSSTVQSVVAELKNAASDDMAAISAAISRGAIMGARGNSGAILAQVLRGVAESAKGKTSLSPHDIAEALEWARRSAYESVLKPVEGTILTVVAAAAAAAKEQADKGAHLKDQLDHVRLATSEALARTPELLPVLKQAGVVDAGATGFLLFVDALRYVATGEPIPGLTDHDESESEVVLGSFDKHDDRTGPRYEVMFLLEGDDAGIGSLREAWSHVGDSIVVVGGDGLWNCHIHSDDIGQAIEVALDYGRPRQIRVTDLVDQVSAEHGEHWSEAAETADHSHECVTGVVAVVNGDGLGRIYRSFGVQKLVLGGQSMNPSVAELLHAIDSASSSCVVILPNNGNVRAAAEQAAQLSDKSVVVVPTESVVQGMGALVAYNADASLDDNARAMTESYRALVYGEVTQAVRDAQDDQRPIKQGDWLGLGADGLRVVAGSVSEALCGLVESLVDDAHEMLTVIEGDGASQQATDAVRSWVGEHRPGLEIEVHEGGQPLYPYLVGLE